MDLNTLFQNGMPSFAAGQSGQQAAVGQAQSLANLQTTDLANQNAAAMNPLNAQFRQGQIDTQQAELPGKQAQSKSLTAQSLLDEATTPSKIAERLSTLKNQIGVDGMQEMQRDGQVATQAAQILKQFPESSHKELLTNIASQYKVDPNSPLLKGIMNLNDDKVQPALENIGKGMSMASSNFMQSSALEAQKAASAAQVANIHSNATIQSANIGANSRVNAAKLKVDAMKATLGTDKTISALENQRAANGGILPPEYEDELNRLKVQQLQNHPGGNTLAPQMVGGDNNYDVARKAVMGNGPKPTVTTPANAPQGVPQGAIDMLKQNPALRTQFDAKYGEGASKQILGN